MWLFMISLKWSASECGPDPMILQPVPAESLVRIKEELLYSVDTTEIREDSMTAAPSKRDSPDTSVASIRARSPVQASI